MVAGRFSTVDPAPSPTTRMERAEGRAAMGRRLSQRVAASRPMGAPGGWITASGSPLVVSRHPPPSSVSSTVAVRPTP